MPEQNPNTRALLERARKLCDPPTWYRLSKSTGIKQQTISQCIAQGKTLGNMNAYKLAKLLQMDAKDVMAYMAEDRAQDEIEKEFWTQRLPRLLPPIAIAAASLLVEAAGGTLIGGTSTLVQGPIDLTRYTLCELEYLGCEEDWAAKFGSRTACC